MLVFTVIEDMTVLFSNITTGTLFSLACKQLQIINATPDNKYTEHKAVASILANSTCCKSRLRIR